MTKSGPWTFDEQPEDPGWYPVLLCWDVNEGFFPDADYWDAQGWGNGAVSHFGPACATEEEAKAWAEENDRGW